jgi:UDP-N-acetylmuramate: L-alanyl-gamma-D-glutamyl-meso-diaminopimelate ligase
MEHSPKHIHIVGICGVATSALAIAFHNKGWKVTGSDKGFFPPVSTELEKHGISFYAGWHPEKMIESGKPDIVVITTFAGTKNPEIVYAQENGITLKPYMEVFRDYFIRPKSVVCTGTWGKTSSSTLLSYILQEAELDPTYMFGGISLSHNASAKLTDSEYSVFEGDEYKSSPTDNTPKFVYYKPTHLLLSAVSWDHADLYPTEESYFNVFKKLISGIPKSGFVVANRDNKKVRELVQDAIWYGKADAKYIYGDVSQTKDGLNFKINGIEIHSPMIGTFQAENITGCFAMASELGIPNEKIVKAISNFKGLKRRLEKRFDNKVTIFDDIAHSPEKATSVLNTIRDIYQGKIITIFEPNSGGRQRDASRKYDHAFKDSTTVIIPRLTKLKVAEGGSDKPLEGEELAEIIKKTQPNTLCIEDDEELVKYLTDNTKDGDVIAFLGSHGFRGMIEATITSLHQQSQ